MARGERRLTPPRRGTRAVACVRTAAAALAAILVLAAAPAAAADRYVAPGGGGAACAQASPCSLATGINDAASGDVVRVAGDSGPYEGVPGSLTVKSGVAVVGEGAAVPRIVMASGTLGVLSGGSVTRLDLGASSFAVALSVAEGGVASQMRVESSTGLPVEVRGILRDSFVRSGKAGVMAVGASGKVAKLRNVTALATGANSVAINYSGSIWPSCGSSEAVEIRNVIARGAQHDLRAANSSFDCMSTETVLDVGHSNYRSGAVDLSGGFGNSALLDAGGNQTAVEPLLAADGLHQLAGSPTIDAGVASPENGPLDIDGEARLQGAAPDIGADEYPPPAPGPVAAPPPPPPAGSALRLNPRRFLPSRSRAASISVTRPQQRGKKRSPRTSKVSYRLTRDARVSFTVQRKAVGRSKGGRCLVGKAARKLTKGKRCAKFLRAGRPFSHSGKQGPNNFRFSGWLRGKRLKPGPHRMVGVPVAVGQRGDSFRATFVIARR